jgi:hypothetical protein
LDSPYRSGRSPDDAEFNATGAEPSADQWRRHWATCIAEASTANVVLVYAACDERQMGALVELGAGLASVRTFFWSPITNGRSRIIRG